MEEKRCADALSYLNDVMDGCASEEISRAFFAHLESCEKCRTKYEIQEKIREILRNHVPHSDANLMADIDRALREREPEAVSRESRGKNRVKMWILVLLILAVAAAALSFGLRKEKPSEELEHQRRVDENGSVIKVRISAENGEKFVQETFYSPLGISVADVSSVEAILSDLQGVGRDYGTDFGTVVFLVCASFDEINRSPDVTYQTGSGTGDLAVFVSDLPYAVFSERFSGIYEEYAVTGGQGMRLLLLVRVL